MLKEAEVIPGIILWPGREDVEPSDLGAARFALYKMSRKPFFLGFKPGKKELTFVIPGKFAGENIVLACRVPIGYPAVVCDGCGKLCASKVNENDYQGYGYEEGFLVVAVGCGDSVSFTEYSVSVSGGIAKINRRSLSDCGLTPFEKARRRLNEKAGSARN